MKEEECGLLDCNAVWFRDIFSVKQTGKLSLLFL
jgi:hypothetical protein